MSVLTATTAGVRGLEGRDVTALAVDHGAGSGGAVWAIVDGREVWRAAASDDDAPAWAHVASWSGPTLTCLAAAAGEVVAGSAEARLARLDAGALHPVTSFDDLPERRAWYTPWGGPPDTRSIAFDGGDAFVNVHVGGVARGAVDGRGGATGEWEALVDIDVDVHQVVVAPDGSLLLATGAAGFGRSTDRGATWAFDADGLHGSYCRAVAVAGDTVLLTASRGPHGSRGAVYRRSLGASGAWEAVTDEVDGNIDTFWLDARDDAAAFVTEAGERWESGDAGRTWSLAGRVAGTPRAVAIA